MWTRCRLGHRCAARPPTGLCRRRHRHRHGQFGIEGHGLREAAGRAGRTGILEATGTRDIAHFSGPGFFRPRWNTGRSARAADPADLGPGMAGRTRRVCASGRDRQVQSRPRHRCAVRHLSGGHRGQALPTGDRCRAGPNVCRTREVQVLDGPPARSTPVAVAVDATGRAERAHAAVTDSMHDLGRSVRKGLVWSFANTIILRLGSLIVGIVLARLLTPEVFGIYAVALAVQSILMTLADLGLSADLVRSRDPGRREPTVATLSLGSGVLLTALMAALASPLADAMGTPQAAPVIVVLSGTLILSSAGVVPYARLQRRFGQRELFASGAVDFVVSTGVTLVLVLAGMGPMALAIARLVAQASATAVQFILSRTRPQFGFDRSIAGPALRFGLPLAGANLLSWALLNVDNIVIARAAGEVALGFYVLAFNVSSWPMTAIGTAIRSVSLAAFSRTT